MKVAASKTQKPTVLIVQSNSPYVISINNLRIGSLYNHQIKHQTRNYLRMDDLQSKLMQKKHLVSRLSPKLNYGQISVPIHTLSLKFIKRAKIVFTNIN
jgi:hypothetical protein